MKRVYVAGAYSADSVIRVLDNMRRGMVLAHAVLRAGFAPFVPWFDYHFSLVGPTTLAEYYAYSMAWLEVSDAVIVQPEGAADSNGTQAEIARAGELGIPVFWNIDDLIGWARRRIAKRCSLPPFEEGPD